MEQTTENSCALCGKPIKDGEGVLWEGKVVCPECLDKKTGILIKHGASVNTKDYIGKTPLHNAAWCGNDKVARALIEHGANVNAKDKKGGTPLFSAAKFGNDKVAGTLIDHRAKVNVKDNNGNTPLDWAVKKKKQAIITLLRKHGAMTAKELSAQAKAKKANK